MKPGSASLPFFGIEPVILDPVSGREIEGGGAEGILAFKQPWPSMARTVWGAHERYMDTYLNPFKGYYASFIHTLNLRFFAFANPFSSILAMALLEMRTGSTGFVGV